MAEQSEGSKHLIGTYRKSMASTQRIINETKELDRS